MEVSEEDWLNEQQEVAYQYMKKSGADHGRIEHSPSFCVSPYVAIWAVESGKSPNSVGWWVITGDVPTDYVSSSGIDSARQALGEFSTRWLLSVKAYKSGKAEPAIALNNETAGLLEKRAQILKEWASDESMWK